MRHVDDLTRRDLMALTGGALLALKTAGAEPEPPAPLVGTRVYQNRLTPIRQAKPLLADYPDFIAPVEELRRFEAPAIVVDEGADLDVRAWRFSYNARGIIEMPNRLRASSTAIICVHPWGID